MPAVECLDKVLFRNMIREEDDTVLREVGHASILDVGREVDVDDNVKALEVRDGCSW